MERTLERTLIVAAGPLNRTLCPARAVVPDLAPDARVRLEEISTGREVPVQVVPGGIVWLIDSLPQGEIRRYRLVAGGGAPSVASFGLADRAGEALDFTVGGAAFTSYNYGSRWARPFFHPVTVAGRRVTRSWPMDELSGETRDHPHHKGIWVAHGDVNGVDDWSEMAGHGRIIHREFARIAAGPVFAEVVEGLDWVSASGVPILDEVRRIAVWNLPTEDRLLDVDVSLTPFGQSVKFGRPDLGPRGDIDGRQQGWADREWVWWQARGGDLGQDRALVPLLRTG
jgi:Methane oxygenase PmoA